MKQQSGMMLSELFKGIQQINEKDDRQIQSLQTDSRTVEQGDVFIAMPGVTRHGLSYLSAIVEAGAIVVIYAKADAENYRRQLNACRGKVVQIEVASIRDVAGQVISRFYDNASQKMSVIGVTGTDGKTSVSRFIAQSLSEDSKTAVIGTTGNGIWGDLTEASHTTPDVLSLHKMLSELKNKSADVVVMEVSSHGIEQGRISGVDIETAILTNVTRDHLDYHGTVETYREIKKRLFYQDSVKNIIVNLDDAIGKELAQSLSATKNVWGYSLCGGCDPAINSTYAALISVKKDGFNVKTVTPSGEIDLHVPFLGRFNISNALTVLCVLLLNKIELHEAARRIAALQTAPGRMEVFKAEEKPLAVVDFAHTPKALELALQAMAEHCKGKIWCVFGCGGDRDQGKRALMGGIAEKYADYVVLTDDNPRHENSADIIAQILSGIENSEQVVVIENRRLAIEYAVQHATKDDVVLVAGKGHESFQITGDLKMPFNDRFEVQRLIGGDQL
ncbi:MAG: UDP-N-acetylmuramoyl-L-alanyl-D-glutamate--2,6-diaminopimelate ligase [Gammaproteobacteria bacterium]|nr:UDP-N-acetylmuramoyl-L-alanyl-D-glutamate--2,6-diaminopimelate ligase [Gammaproteobacteria bacterium]